ncbi:hypothetical protein EMGBS12_11370 [Methylophilaceae bacterium]|nr:hypothetical protein EMGBS12_11370 [Methylophilaceae bacterium]
MLTGFPKKTYERMQFLAQTNESHFNIFILIIAILLTLVWIFLWLKQELQIAHALRIGLLVSL